MKKRGCVPSMARDHCEGQPSHHEGRDKELPWISFDIVPAKLDIGTLQAKIVGDPLEQRNSLRRALMDSASMRTTLSRADFVMLRHLDATWHRARREGIDPHLCIEREERRFSLVRRYDPTEEGLYHWWLSCWRRRLWDERGFGAPVTGDDLLEVRRALARFHAMRDRLPVERRDIGQYRTIDDLQATIPTQVAEHRRRKEARLLKGRAHSQSELLFLEGPWRIVRLFGYDAARFWGLGTRWCTTQSEATYLQYVRSAPLFVFLTPRGKFQLQQGGSFRNSEDRDAWQEDFQDAPTAFRALLVRLRH